MGAGSPSGPCSGLRVVDMSSLVAGPFAAQFLADLGADVIKVESPGSDLMRHVGGANNGITAAFEQHNRGKRSVNLDLKQDQDRASLHRLCDTADVLIQNSRPGVMERLGIGYEAVAKTNPRIIYTSISGFGETGPYASRPAYDGVIQGLTGFLYEQGEGKAPKPIRSMVADRMTAIFAVQATLAALFHRERTGEGQKVVVSMLKAYSAFILPDQIYDLTFPDAALPPVQSSMGAHIPLKTANGEAIGMVLQRHQFEAMVKVLGREDLLDDPRFASAQTISPNSAALYAAIEPQTTALSTERFLALMAEAGVPFGRVNTPADFFDDPQAIHSGAWQEFHDDMLGRVRHLGHPADFARTPAVVDRRAPLFGEHTEEVLASLAPAQS